MQGVLFAPDPPGQGKGYEGLFNHIIYTRYTDVALNRAGYDGREALNKARPMQVDEEGKAISQEQLKQLKIQKRIEERKREEQLAKILHDGDVPETK